MSYKKVKRILDILVSLFLIILFSPLFLLVSSLIWLLDKNNVFVKEPQRLGFKGKEFKMYKFRSMIPDAHNKIKEDPKYESWIKNG
jgi:lipopolysaccharide/colanic/teichoic acid biosynthesis glycosyltransferase